MVYYYTSTNIKVLRNIIIDFEASKELSPQEYMKMYIEKCPDSIDDSKISWIVENFLSFQKHGPFLRDMVSHLTEELSEEDCDYFMIQLNAVIFHLTPSDMHLLYKCFFNLSKSLLNIFTAFLSNNEVLTFISQIAQTHYDINFISERIINPLFTWQPYISEMGHNYAQYVKKIESRKIKLPTIPIQPNVLNRKGKEDHCRKEVHSGEVDHSRKPTIPETPPNSLNQKGKKMLTKSVIDEKLKEIHENNKQKGLDLLKEIKAKDYHFAQGKSDQYYKKITNIRDEIENKSLRTVPKEKQRLLNCTTQPIVKDTATTVRRLNKRIEISEKEEVQWLQNLLTSCRDTLKIEEIEEHDRQEKERKRLLDIKKKHLLGQISYEEAVIAKKKLHDDNKKKHEMFLKEKHSWEEEIERWKKEEMEKNRKQVEKLSLIELEMLHAKHNVTMKKKEIADKKRKESEELLSRAMKEKQENLDRRIKMIKEIKILALIAKKAKVPKIIDLTESSGLGFLCEMSMAELQERLGFLKVGLKEELEKKKTHIKQRKEAAKRELEETKKSNKNFIVERASLKQLQKKKCISNPREISASKEILELKKVLEEKRKLRIMLTR
ncbi:cilia- and flagella-associated protein 99-like [Bicyclus anynana]|uniref:Cilia- and flagella-associated protein 99-like n=1 Tax=Bicyclus anynana TaxID=110368 RepID=A0A6J1NZK7_BICAN|nr:cilia- and flagella-associated protein 99-like [Bicyclus anynana]